MRSPAPIACARAASRLVLLLAPSLVCLGACSAKASGECTGVAACGGSLVGTWTLASVCFSGSAAVSGVCTADVQSSQIDVSGSVQWKANMTYNPSVDVSGTVGVGLPASCLRVNGEAVSCAGLSESVGTMGGWASSTCASASSGCSCTEKVTKVSGYAPLAGKGHYAVTGNVVTMTSNAGSVEQYGYCVNGSTLVLVPEEAGSLRGTMVLELK